MQDAAVGSMKRADLVGYANKVRALGIIFQVISAPRWFVDGAGWTACRCFLRRSIRAPCRATWCCPLVATTALASALWLAVSKPGQRLLWCGW